MSELINMWTFVRNRKKCNETSKFLKELSHAYRVFGNTELADRCDHFAHNIGDVEYFTLRFLNYVKMGKLKIGDEVIPIGVKDD